MRGPCALHGRVHTVIETNGYFGDRLSDADLENVDLVIDFDIRGSKRLHDQVMITLLHHNHVRTVSTGE